MRLDAATWESLAELTKAGITRWKASAYEKGCKDTFAVNVHDDGPYQILLTTHFDGYRWASKAVAYKAETGTLFSAKLNRKKRCCDIKPAPKAWAKLEGQSADKIYEAIKLADFCMLISSSHAEEVRAL